MRKQAMATLFLEEPDKQYVLVIKFQQLSGGVQARLMQVFNATTTEEVDRNEWPSPERFQDLLEAHHWAYNNDPDRERRSRTANLYNAIRERQQLNAEADCDDSDADDFLPPWSAN
jgi:hypothetical protein